MPIMDQLSLAFSSLWHRRFSAILTILAVAFAVMLFLGIDKTRKAAYQSFENTISGTQLIVGARTSPESLVLSSVFNIGNVSASVSGEALEWLESQPSVEWSVPIALGDNHRGYRVIGTTPEYFEHIQYRRDRSLAFTEGQAFSELFDVTIGANVAKEQGYTLGDAIVLSHGSGDDFGGGHDNLPFKISGILERTGTPIDETVFVSLEAIEAIHIGWESGARSPVVDLIKPEDFVTTDADVPEKDVEHDAHDHEKHDQHEHDAHEHEEHDQHEHDAHDHEGHDHQHDLSADSVSAVFVGLTGKNPFIIKRQIDTYSEEALIAAVPSLALQNIWSAIGIAENALLLVSGFVIVVGLVSILTSIMTSVRERRREMAVLRAVGASPGNIINLICGEAFLLALIGTIVGILTTYGAFAIVSPIIEQEFSIALNTIGLGKEDGLLLLALPVIAALLGLIPGIQAMRHSLADGLSIKL